MALHMVSLLWSSALAAGVFLLSWTVRFLSSTRRPANFPPGPSPVLGLGNLHQIPPDRPFLKFHEWFRTYGPVVGLKIGPKNVLLLSDPAHVRELFVRRASRYSDRPENPLLAGYIFKPPHESWLTMPDDAKLKRWRAAVRHVMSPEGIARSGPPQTAIAARFLRDLLQEPGSWTTSVRKWALSSTLSLVYGQELDAHGSDFTGRYFALQKDYLQLLEPNSAPPIEIFPILAYVPAFLAKWKQRAAVIRDGVVNIYTISLEMTQSCFARGHPTAYGSLVTYLLQRRETDEKLHMPDNELMLLAGGMLDGGVDTTYASINSVMLCLVAHPQVMQRAQAEVDQVCGRKCPGFDDLRRLSFVTACVLEVFRWRGVAQFGLPHLLTEDDVFEGYTIPKGTTVIASAYSMHLRPEDYDRPDVFDPDRYMRNPLGVRGAPSQVEEGRKATYTFGIGRRVCPGEDFARSMITVMTAKLLWAFDFEVDGEPDLSWETGYRPGLSNPPQNFHPKVRPRMATTAGEVEREFSKSEDYLAKPKLAKV